MEKSPRGIVPSFPQKIGTPAPWGASFALSPVDREPARRRAYALREVSRSLLMAYELGGHFPGLITCGLPLTQGEWVSLALYEGEEVVARATGIRTCGSVWACPVCAPVEADRRGEALARVVARRWARGWRVAHAVLTVRHTRGQGLEAVFRVLSQAWRRMTSHRAVRGFLQGWEWHRAVEITYGGNGWHPHLHLLLLAPPGVDPYLLEEPLWEAWREAVEAVGWAPSSRGGYAYQVPESQEDAVEVSRYNEKTWGLPQESSLGPRKEGKGGLGPFELLAVAAQGVEDEDLWATPELVDPIFEEELEGVGLDTPGLLRPRPRARVSPVVARTLWVEYVEATKGRKRTGMSRGLQAEVQQVLEEVEAEGKAAFRGLRLREVVQVRFRTYLWLLRARRLAYLLHWAEVLGSLAQACALAGLVPEEEWREVYRAQAPPEEGVA